jgi:hypothetical protein
MHVFTTFLRLSSVWQDRKSIVYAEFCIFISKQLKKVTTMDWSVMHHLELHAVNYHCRLCYSNVCTVDSLYPKK